MKQPVIYIHGGPGFNSNPERNLVNDVQSLTNHYDFSFWDEPSKLRETSHGPVNIDICILSLQTMISDVFSRSGMPAIIIAHSFGANLLLRSLGDVSKKISRLIFVAPAFDLKAADYNILSIAKRDLETLPNPTEEQKNAAARIGELLVDMSVTQQYPDSDRFIEGMNLAVLDPLLMTHYWRNREMMNRYYAYFADPCFSFDFENFINIRLSCDPWSQLLPTPIPALVVFGSEDPVTPSESQSAGIYNLLKNYKLTIVNHCSHYPHLENMALFVELLNTFLNDKEMKQSLDAKLGTVQLG